MSQRAFSFAESLDGRPAAAFAAASEDVISAWAIGETRAMSERERRLTAAIYAQLPGVIEHVRREGTLPRRMPGGAKEVGLRALVQRRGIDLELSEAEREVLDAIGLEAELVEGRAVLLGRDRAVSSP